MSRGGANRAPAPTEEARAAGGGGRGLLITIAIAAVLGLGAFLLARTQATTPPALLEAGADAPAFSLPAEGGDVVAVPSPGVPTLVVFVETHCASCREEGPILASLARNGHRVVAVDVSDSSPEERQAFLRDSLEGEVPLAHDVDGRIAAAYRARVVPTAYAVDADGTIADAWAGRVPAERFEQALGAAAAQ